MYFNPICVSPICHHILEKSCVGPNGKISAVLSVSLQPNLKDERQIEIIAKDITTNLVLVHKKNLLFVSFIASFWNWVFIEWSWQMVHTFIKTDCQGLLFLRKVLASVGLCHPNLFLVFCILPTFPVQHLTFDLSSLSHHRIKTGIDHHHHYRHHKSHHQVDTGSAASLWIPRLGVNYNLLHTPNSAISQFCHLYLISYKSYVSHDFHFFCTGP